MGGPVIDPTENVLALVDVEKQHAQELRIADNKYNETIRNLNAKFQDALRHAETRRIDQLAALRVQYDVIIEGMRSTSLNTTSQLLATQLREVKLDLSDRTAKLEQFRWETGGKSTGLGQFSGIIVQVITSLASIAAIITAVILTRH
jgi:hypothetical protein